MQETYAYSTLRRPKEALDAAKRIGPEDLKGISRGAHLMDVAQANWTAGWARAAEERLREAREISRVWFAHQRIAGAVVTDIRERQSRVSEGIRDLASTLGV